MSHAVKRSVSPISFLFWKANSRTHGCSALRNGSQNEKGGPADGPPFCSTPETRRSRQSVVRLAILGVRRLHAGVAAVIALGKIGLRLVVELAAIEIDPDNLVGAASGRGRLGGRVQGGGRIGGARPRRCQDQQGSQRRGCIFHD